MSTVNHKRIGELGLARLSNEKQRAACVLMLEAAYLTGSSADVVHLQQHAHNLLQADMKLQQDYYHELRKAF